MTRVTDGDNGTGGDGEGVTGGDNVVMVLGDEGESNIHPRQHPTSP